MRMYKGKSKVEVSKRANISARSLSRYEEGTHQPTAETLGGILSACGHEKVWHAVEDACKFRDPKKEIVFDKNDMIDKLQDKIEDGLKQFEKHKKASAFMLFAKAWVLIAGINFMIYQDFQTPTKATSLPSPDTNIREKEYILEEALKKQKVACIKDAHNFIENRDIEDDDLRQRLIEFKCDWLTENSDRWIKEN